MSSATQIRLVVAILSINTTMGSISVSEAEICSNYSRGGYDACKHRNEIREAIEYLKRLDQKPLQLQRCVCRKELNGEDFCYYEDSSGRCDPRK